MLVSVKEDRVRTAEEYGGRFEWVGGARPLDFANTVTWTEAGLEHERLASYADLLAWAHACGLLRPEAAARLRQRTGPGAAGAALERARERRRLLHAAFVSAATGLPLRADDLRALNTAVRDAARHLRLEAGAGGWTLTVRPPETDLDGVLHAVTWEAARLLGSEDRLRLKHCAAGDCGWVFLDGSRNHRRRWCDMKVCGNNEKARRFYRRHRVGPSAEGGV
jgi:predicted RNA-binding Zn ribbon-like protein